MKKWLNDFNEWYSKKKDKRKFFPRGFYFLKWLYEEKFMKQDFMLVNWSWRLRLKLHNAMSPRKIKVGFGPVVSGEHTLGNRKWHIDPLVDYINKHSEKYACDIFFNNDSLDRFDIVIHVKTFDNMSAEKIERLKQNKTILIYDISDNPLGCKKSYLKDTWYIKSMDAVIAMNPLQESDVRSYNNCVKLIGLPIINHRYKKDYAAKEPVVILWEGYIQNMEYMNRFNAIVKRIAGEGKHKVTMLYHANMRSKDDGIIKYRKWKLDNWEKVFLESDIAVAIKPGDNEIQRRKPSTKVNTYRAAGLPLVCMPSEADKTVIEDGKTGYFAYTDEDWYARLKELVENPALREKIGVAGRKYVRENFSIAKIGAGYIRLFDELVAKKVC
ncbi:MAG: glycosyltransferase [Candidatus Omnitrophica bacterium]|nr:glycosyltransferase [Candidatus Omnitrophota bacterium]